MESVLQSFLNNNILNNNKKLIKKSYIDTLYKKYSNIILEIEKKYPSYKSIDDICYIGCFLIDTTKFNILQDHYYNIFSKIKLKYPKDKKICLINHMFLRLFKLFHCLKACIIYNELGIIRKYFSYAKYENKCECIVSFILCNEYNPVSIEKNVKYIYPEEILIDKIYNIGVDLVKLWRKLKEQEINMKYTVKVYNNFPIRLTDNHKLILSNKSNDNYKKLKKLIKFLYKNKYKVKEKCFNCEKKTTLKKCDNCKRVYYCSYECQKEDWLLHKKCCNYMKKNFL